MGERNDCGHRQPGVRDGAAAEPLAEGGCCECGGRDFAVPEDEEGVGSTASDRGPGPRLAVPNVTSDAPRRVVAECEHCGAEQWPDGKIRPIGRIGCRCGRTSFAVMRDDGGAWESVFE
ncbi:hypothetical protein BRD03_09045 [Halobacteriales archaeon QS_9_68_17]|nr:MAG: hypothetical protein BRD03_09045 [Halobacteriales archaeon QS_9_68_17]